jgi:hypothetical protein
VSNDNNLLDGNSYRKDLFELGSLVNGNRAKSHAHRSQIIDNISKGLGGLLVAYNRNRNLMSEMTTNIYRSRRIFVEGHPDFQKLDAGQKQRVMDEVEYQCLKQRSDSNREIMNLNVALTSFNEEFIKLLHSISATNLSKLDFNAAQHEKNIEILENGPGAAGLSPDSAALSVLIVELLDQVVGNSELLEEGFEASNSNQQKFGEIRDNLDQELEKINEDWDKIEAQQHLAAELLHDMEIR